MEVKFHNKLGKKDKRNARGKRVDTLPGKAIFLGLQIGNWTINDLGRVSAYRRVTFAELDGSEPTPRRSAYLCLFNYLTDKIEL